MTSPKASAMQKQRRLDEMVGLVTVSVRIPATNASDYIARACADRADHYESLHEANDAFIVGLLASRRSVFTAPTPDSMLAWTGNEVQQYDFYTTKMRNIEKALGNVDENPPGSEEELILRAERFVVSARLAAIVVMAGGGA